MTGTPETIPVDGRGRVHAAVTITRAAAARGWAMIAIPGATYDYTLFDCPVPGYSFASRLSSAGITVIAADRPGTGQSTPVPGPDAGLDATAETTAAVTAWAQKRFPHTVLFGHGIGAMAATAATALLPPSSRPDLLILAAARHNPDPPPLLEHLAPAADDPRFRQAEPGWTVAADPEHRRKILHGDSAAREILDWDTGTIASAREAADAIKWMKTPPGQGVCAQVTSPVLLLAGENDPFNSAPDSAALAAAEKPWYPRAAAFTAHLVPGAAHSTILAPGSAQSIDVIAAMIPLLAAGRTAQILPG